MLLLFRSEETRVIPDRTAEIRGNSRDLGSRRWNSTSFAGSLRQGGFCRVGSSSSNSTETMRRDETRYPGENEEEGRRKKEKRDRGEEVTRSSCVFATGGAIIRSRHQKYQWRNGSLIPRPAPCQCLSSTSFISFIHFFVIPTYPPRHPVLLRGSAVCTRCSSSSPDDCIDRVGG